MSAADLGGSVVGDRPVATDQIRRANTALVLRALRDGGPASRAELAKSTGLTKSTVSTIVGRLHELGAVEQGMSSPRAAARGRPATPVHLSGARLVGLGIEVNVDYLAAAALDLAGRSVLSEERVVRSPGRVDDVREFLGSCIDSLSTDRRRLLGVTVAVPGLVDRDRGRIHSAPNLGWTGLDLAESLADLVGAAGPTRMDNDANCAALAEATHGVAAGLRDVVYVTGTVGVGGGIIADGRVLRGGRGYAGEVGHMRIGTSDAVCVCGRRGCWEAMVGLRAMLAAVDMDEPAVLDPVDIARRVADRAAKERRVRAALDKVATSLATGCAVLANAFDPSMIVLGGYFVPLGRWLLPVVQQAVDEQVFARGGCRVVLSTLGLHAAARGAATETITDIFDARLPLDAAP